MKTASASKTQTLLLWANNKPMTRTCACKHRLCLAEQTTVQSNMVSMCTDDGNQLKFHQCCMTSDFLFCFPLAHIDFLSVFYCQWSFSWFTLPDAMTAKCRSHKTLFFPPAIGCYSCTTHTLGLCRQTDRETDRQRTVLTCGIWPKTSRLEGAVSVVKDPTSTDKGLGLPGWCSQRPTDRTELCS